MKATKKRVAFVEAIKAEFGPVTQVTRPQVSVVVAKTKMGWPYWLTGDPAHVAGRGVYNIPTLEAKAVTEVPAAPETAPTA